METESKSVEPTTNEDFSRIPSGRLEVVLLVAAVVANIASWTLVLWKIPYRADTVILHYNIYFGVDLSGPWWRVCVLPGFGIAAILIHRFILRPYDTAHPIMRTVSFAILLLIQLLLLLAIALIVPLNT